MKKTIQKKNKIIIALCITLIFLGIGFIILSIRLKNLNEEEHTFQVLFTKVEKSSSIRGAKKDPTAKASITPNGGRLELDMTLNSPHDEVSYIATIKNTGNIKAEIVEVLESPEYTEPNFKKLISPVTITTSDIKGKIIPPDDEINVKITAYYNPTEEEIKEKIIKYNLSFLAKSVD